jgi:hypothetical protein
LGGHPLPRFGRAVGVVARGAVALRGLPLPRFSGATGVLARGAIGARESTDVSAGVSGGCWWNRVTQFSRVKGLKILFAAVLFYSLGISLGKLSVVYFYSRVFSSHNKGVTFYKVLCDIGIIIVL